MASRRYSICKLQNLLVVLTIAICMISCTKVKRMLKFSDHKKDQNSDLNIGNKVNSPANNVANSSVGKKSEAANQYWSYFVAKRQNLEDIVTLDGKLESSIKIDMRADKRMRVGPAKFKVGDRVKKNDVLFEVDTKEFEQKRQAATEHLAQLKVDIMSSQAQLIYAQKQLERKTSLTQKGIAAQKDLEDAQKQFVSAETDAKTKELELRKAERELASASASVSAANVLSPIEGIVSSIIAGGDDVNQGQPMATISNPSQLGLNVPVDETLVTRFKAGEMVDVTFDAGDQAGDTNQSGSGIKGEVKSIDIKASAQGAGINTYNMNVELSASTVKNFHLREGYSAHIRAVFGLSKNVVVVPRAVIKKNGRDSFVMTSIARGLSPSARAVKVGLATSLEAEITDGLKDGDIVAVASEIEQETKQ